MTPLATIEEYFKNNRPITGPVELNSSTRIIDTEKFVQAHITILKNNSGNRVYLPYYLRLEKLYKIQLSHDNTNEHSAICEEDR